MFIWLSCLDFGCLLGYLQEIGLKLVSCPFIGPQDLEVTCFLLHGICELQNGLHVSFP